MGCAAGFVGVLLFIVESFFIPIDGENDFLLSVFGLFVLFESFAVLQHRICTLCTIALRLKRYVAKEEKRPKSKRRKQAQVHPTAHLAQSTDVPGPLPPSNAMQHHGSSIAESQVDIMEPPGRQDDEFQLGASASALSWPLG